MTSLNRAALPLLAAGLLVAPVGTAPTPAQAATRPTVFQTLKPFDSHGRLVVRATIKATPRGSHCIESGVTGRRDAYRCFIGNYVIDPMFKSPTSNRVAYRDGRGRWTVYRVSNVSRSYSGHAVVHEVKLANGASCYAMRVMGGEPAPGYPEWIGQCFGGPYKTPGNWLARDWSTAHTNWPLLRNPKAGTQWLAPVESSGKVTLRLVAVAYR